MEHATTLTRSYSNFKWSGTTPSLQTFWYVGTPKSWTFQNPSQQGTALQMGGVLLYKLEVYCQYFSDKLYGLGVPEQCPLISRTHPSRDVIFFGQISAKKAPEINSAHDVWEP